MCSKIAIRGCYSVRDKKGTGQVAVADTPFTVTINPAGLVMAGNGALPPEIIQIGNQIRIELERNTYDRENSFWLEKTDVPYMDKMEANKWRNMIREGSRVFEQIYGSAEEAAAGKKEEEEEKKKTVIIDPPTSGTNGTRKLEFAIYLRGEGTKKNFLMLAEQNIFVDKKAGTPSQSVFTVHRCGFVLIPDELNGEEEEEEENAVSQLEQMLKLIDSEWDDSAEKKTMQDILVQVGQIPADQFAAVAVQYDTGTVYEFNSWGTPDNCPESKVSE